MPAVPPAVVKLYASLTGRPPVSVRDVAGDASRRLMVRATGEDGSTVVAVIGPDPDENRAFISFTRAFRSIGLPVPDVLAVDEAAGVYLVEDLGDTTLFQLLDRTRTLDDPFPESVRPHFRRVLEILPRFQVEGVDVVDFSVAHPRTEFDRRAMAWDLASFKYNLLKLAAIPYHEDRLEDDFERLIEALLAVPRDVFCYRDFQSRNVMLKDGEPWFIDYQGGRLGAPHYDVASLLYSGKTQLPDPVRAELLEHYLDALEAHRPVDRDAFRKQYYRFVALRIFQAMGVYGYVGLFQKKPHFAKSLPPAARNLRTLLVTGLFDDTPELLCAVEALVDRYADVVEEPVPSGLVVRIGSFSYKQGQPPDDGGHGGGFVFDCRALPNPGRLPEYTTVTGRDSEVVRWLEAEAAIDPFHERARGLVDAQIRTYIDRGFTALQVLYGCTGGQHRSVYFAERLARELAEAFSDVTFEVTHHNQANWPG